MKKLLILCMTFLCILTGCGNTDSAKNTEQNSSYQQVSMEEGLELMKEDSGYILLDVRQQNSTSDIRKSVHITLLYDISVNVSRLI